MHLPPPVREHTDREYPGCDFRRADRDFIRGPVYTARGIRGGRFITPGGGKATPSGLGGF
eukprot:4499753-Pyramimonas_sp.AAC.3